MAMKIRVKACEGSDPTTIFAGGFTLKRTGNKITLTGNGVNHEWKMGTTVGAKEKFSNMWTTLNYFSAGRLTLKELLQRFGIDA